MQPFTLVLITLTLAAAGPVHAAGEIHVPGDYLDPQAAINAALPGDLIVVHGGTWRSITIDKPLHLLGDPAPLFEGMLQGTFSLDYVSPLTLAGPGSGVVTLSNIKTGGSIGGIASHVGSGVTGGGFDELHIFDSVLRGNAWTAVTDPAPGAPGLSVSVPFVLIERSTVEASASLEVTGLGGAESVAGIQASSSTVVVLDSTVKGGTGGPWYMHPSWGPCSGFGSCTPCAIGVGGAGIKCHTLHHAGSTIIGGKGADWYDDTWAYCTTLPDGPAVSAVVEVPLSNNLVGTDKMKLGSTYGLLWTTPGPSAWLFFSLGVGPPLQIPGLGLGYLDLGSAVSLGVHAAPGAATFAIPSTPALLGQTVAFQAFDPTAGVITRPVAGTLQH